jgi:hypothetical protein
MCCLMLLLELRFLIRDRYIYDKCASCMLSIRKFHGSYYGQLESITP